MRVSQWYAEGYLCPRCGKPLIWIGEWHGPRYVRKFHEVKVDRQVGSGDRPVREEVSRTGLEVKTRTVWIHKVTLECKWCSLWLSEGQARRGAPAELPGDWWETGPGATAPSANGVQTGAAR